LAKGKGERQGRRAERSRREGSAGQKDDPAPRRQTNAAGGAPWRMDAQEWEADEHRNRNIGRRQDTTVKQGREGKEAYRTRTEAMEASSKDCIGKGDT